MRFQFKVVLCLLLLTLISVTVTFWLKCDVTRHQDNYHSREISAVELPVNPVVPVDEDKNAVVFRDEDRQGDLVEVVGQGDLRPLDCLINEEVRVNCKWDGDQVYVPFDFLEKYFEVYGKITEKDGMPRFEWMHSYSKVYTPQGTYSPRGIFMSFEHYNVEIRDRVKCISGIEGVPISTQWGPQGYFYPIQIAQYGLSHYSKYLVDKPATSTVIEDGEDGTISRWETPHNGQSITNVFTETPRSRVIEFQTPDSLKEPGVKLEVASITELFLSLDLKFSSNGSVTVIIQPKGKQPDTYYIHYIMSQTPILMHDNNIYIGIGKRSRWSHITRDISNDFQKGLALKYSKRNKPKLVLHKIISLVFRGQGFLDNVTLSSSAHLAQFYYAANWLVLHQDDRGGWPIMVTRRLSTGMGELPPGWYSAMAQGQAMSLLIRAYIRTHNAKYLSAALKATKLFSIPSGKGGVLAHFADKYAWYEEYPTTPSSYVLNGFIYSLLGLYDLKSVAPDADSGEADRLYMQGLRSLRALLPLFDTGSGSVYDLRHYSLGSAPNLARWDYHATHINQLLLLATIDEEGQSLYSNTAHRWIGYMKGKRASHN